MEFKTFAAAITVVGLLLGLTSMALNTAYTRGHAAGASKVLAEWQKADKARTKATNQAFTALIARANRLQDQLETQALTHHQENARAAQELNRLRAAVRTGSVRLSVTTTGTGTACPASPGPQSPGIATGPDRARAELDPATADALVAITADGDTAIRDLNACIQQYDTVRQSINAAATAAQE